MISILIVCVVGLILWALIWSIVSFFKILSLEKRHRRIETALAEHDVLLDDLRGATRWRQTGADTASAPVSKVAPPPLEPGTVFPPPTSATIPVSLEPPAPPKPEAVPAPPPPRPVAEPARAAVASPARPTRPAIDWEMFLGVKLFAWIGGLALFLGVTYFVKYSFENNLIPPAVRMALGYLAGTGLLAGGLTLARRPYRVTAQTLCATGVVILYAVTFACHTIYHFAFFGALPTFLLMVLITAAAFVVAVALEAQVVALLGMLGGFLTPVLLSTGVDNPLGLFGYVALLDVGLLAVAQRRRWFYLGALAALGTVLMQAGWVGHFFTAAKIQTAVNVFLGFSLLFLFAFLFAGRRRAAGPARKERAWVAGAAAGVAFAALAFAFYLLDYPRVAAQPWFFFGLSFGADLCLLVLAVADAPPPDGVGLARLHLAAGSATFLLLAAWVFGQATDELLAWFLAAGFVFALLHTVFPLVLERVRPGAAPAWWSHLFPPAALLVVLLAVLRLPDISFLIWPGVLLIDLLAIAVALWSGAVLAVAGAVVLTMVTLGCWILRVPAALAVPSTLLLTTAGFGVLFFAAGVHGWRQISRGTATGKTPAWLAGPSGAEHLPVLSAVLPFLLLVLVVVRLPAASPAPAFGLALLFVALLVGLAWLLRDGRLPAVALACTFLLEFVWLQRRFTPEHAGVALGWNLGFFLVFAVLPFAARRRLAGQLASWVTAALAAPAHFYLVYETVQRAWPNGYMGLIPAAFALPALASLVATLRLLPADAPRRLDVLAWFGAVALFFVTLIFPIQFERQWITLGWALEGAALLWLFHRVPHPGLRLAGVGLLIAAFVRLALNPAVLAYHPRTATPILNWYLYAYGLATLCLIAGARLLAPPRDRVLGSNARAVLFTLAGVLAFLLLNLEIADYYSPAGQTLTFQFSGDFARDMTYTIAWSLYAFGLLVLGIARRVAAIRRAAIGLLSVALLKLFLHDLAHLDQLYRIAALVVVAVIAILASFLYQRFLPSPPRR